MMKKLALLTLSLIAASSFAMEKKSVIIIDESTANKIAQDAILMTTKDFAKKYKDSEEAPLVLQRLIDVTHAVERKFDVRSDSPDFADKKRQVLKYMLNQTQ